jgi:hypothetical protein
VVGVRLQHPGGVAQGLGVPPGLGEQLGQVRAERHVGLVGRHCSLDRRDH